MLGLSFFQKYLQNTSSTLAYQRNLPLSSEDSFLFASGNVQKWESSCQIVYFGIFQVRTVLNGMSASQENQIYNEAYSGNLAFVKVKVEENPDLVKAQDSNGRSLLHWASLSGNVELVQYLLDAGSDVNLPDDIGMTPLILGASAGKVQVCHLLISKGANVNAKNDEGHSSLQYAASKGWNDIVKMLLINHADINIADKRGARPLHRAASQGKTAVLKILLDFGNQLIINATDVYGNTALHLSCEEDRLEEAKLLISHGAKTDIKNKEGQLPLDLASPNLRAALAKISS